MPLRALLSRVSRETARWALLVSRETVLLPVHTWRLISPFLGDRCKYVPSCSAYAVDAVRQRGILVGVPLAAWRVLRCNPWSLGGIDPVRPSRRHRCSAPPHGEVESPGDADLPARGCSVPARERT